MPFDRPRLRPYLQCERSPANSRDVYLTDQLGLARPFALTAMEASWLEFLDGEHTLEELQLQAMRRLNGQLVPMDHLRRWLIRLEEGLLLDSPRFREIVNGSIRPPRCLGTYEPDADKLRRQLHRLFTSPGGTGLPRPTRPDGSLRAALIPHIDYRRGGLSYTYAFKEIVEKSDASLFVIIGTSHYSGHRFTLTRKHFRTPLGVMQTDQDYIDRLVKHFGKGLLADEWLAHFPEHSIELEVVFLQYVYEKVRPIRIVPLVVGSFHDCVLTGQEPKHSADIACMIEALRRAEAETAEPICYIISGDLAHIGPKFEPGQRLDERLLRHSLQQDQTLVRHIEGVQIDRYFRVIANEADERNICGLPPSVTALEAIRPRSGKLLNYDRYVHPHGHESVSFASAAFYR